MMKSEDAGDVDPIVIILLCIFVPPAAVYLVHGIGSKFWVNLILTLLCGIPGLIHAFVVCKGKY